MNEQVSINEQSLKTVLGGPMKGMQVVPVNMKRVVCCSVCNIHPYRVTKSHPGYIDHFCSLAIVPKSTVLTSKTFLEWGGGSVSNNGLLVWNREHTVQVVMQETP